MAWIAIPVIGLCCSLGAYCLWFLFDGYRMFDRMGLVQDELREAQ